MTGGRPKFAGVSIAAALAIAFVTASAGAAATERTDSTMRATLAARWSAANQRAVEELESHRGFALPPPALAAMAKHELSSGRYRLGVSHARESTALPWWLRAWDWIGERWRTFWRKVFGDVTIGRGQTIVIGDVLLALAAVCVIAAVLRLFGGLMFERASRARSEPVSRVLDASEWYARARDRALRGDYAGATQWLFAAALAALSVRGLLDDDRSATVGEFRRTLRRRDPELLPAFDAIAAEFVDATYAQVPVAAAQWERACDGYLALQRAVQT